MYPLLGFHPYVVLLCNMRVYPVNPIFALIYLDPTKIFLRQLVGKFNVSVIGFSSLCGAAMQHEGLSCKPNFLV